MHIRKYLGLKLLIRVQLGKIVKFTLFNRSYDL